MDLLYLRTMKKIRISLETFEDLLKSNKNQAFYDLLKNLLDEGYTIQPFKDNLRVESKPVHDIPHLNNLIKMIERDGSHC